MLLLIGIGVRADDGAPKDPFADDLPKVEAAALHEQTLDEAPADVTVISRKDIRTYGYRTLGEALNSVRGFYSSRDHMYTFMGVSGFSLPGDYNTRFLVMINSHPLTDNIYSSNGAFEQDFGLDLDLVERIEVVRGPSSALYGSNGIFATINIVTVSPLDFPAAFATIEAGSFGEKKAMFAGSYYLGKGANLLVSGSVVNSSGESFFFPELDSEQYGYGRAIGMDGERAYHTFANLVWRNWNIVAYFNGRDKAAPVAYDFSANTLSARASHVDDSNNYVNAVYGRTLWRGDLRWAIGYNQYRYADRFDFLTQDGGLLDRRSYALGDWLTSRLTYRVPAGVWGTLTAGARASVDLRNLQYDREVWPQAATLFSISKPQGGIGVFVQDEKQLSRQWDLDAGVRLDESRYYGHFLSPRAAISFHATARTVYKLIYGRPFRNPNTYEQFYADGVAFLPAPPLKPETANTFELVAQHRFGHGVRGSVNVYDYRLKNLIEAVYEDNGASQVNNVSGSKSRGVEWELGGKPRRWLDTDASFSWQKANPDGSAARFPNSPAYLAKGRWAIPAGRRVTFANSVQWMSSRLTYAGDVVRPVLLVDVTLTVRPLRAGFEVQAGVRNALNWWYQDPIGLSLDQIRGDPRTAYVKVSWNPGK
ncbi:MAG TPA: TonB-dependent receptor [Bryobacteraceae bacterium]|nr:TonB-dependent receptor [Bryobacteraceae bacterium]